VQSLAYSGYVSVDWWVSLTLANPNLSPNPNG